MTHDAVRALVAEMKATASASVRAHGQLLGVEESFIAALCAALGEISVDEALDALTRESFRLRQQILDENRKADTP